MQPILPITVHARKMKGAARQLFRDGDGVVRSEQTFGMLACCVERLNLM